MRNQLLLIAECPDLRESLAMELRSEGCNVWTAATGLQGLQAARVLLPDLVILDLSLADMDGQVVCRILRGLASTSAIPIITLLTPADASARLFLAELGVAGCLTQPYTRGDLVDLARSALEQGGEPDSRGKHLKTKPALAVA